MSSYASSRAWGNFYSDANLQQAFAEYWQTVARAFKGLPHIVGYELLNEPWMGNVYEDPSAPLPGHVDKKYLAPLYRLLHEAIRAEDDEAILFYEPSVHEEFVWQQNSGFDEGPGGVEYNDRQVFSYHACVARERERGSEGHRP